MTSDNRWLMHELALAMIYRASPKMESSDLKSNSHLKFIAEIVSHALFKTIQ